MTTEGEGPVEEITKGHVGKVPVWAILLGVAVVGGLMYWLYSRYTQGGTKINVPSTPEGGGTPAADLSAIAGALGDIQTQIGGLTGAPSTTTPLVNASWLQKAIDVVTQTLHLSQSEASLYLQQYLQGGGPVGNAQAQSSYTSAINAALGALGQPANPPSQAPAGTNPYGSTANYLNSLLAFLPTGTSQSVINEIEQLYNGTVNYISQEAATALQSAQNVVGTGPTSVIYKIGQAPSMPEITAQAWANAMDIYGRENPSWYNPAGGIVDAFHNFQNLGAGMLNLKPSDFSTGWWAYVYNTLSSPEYQTSASLPPEQVFAKQSAFFNSAIKQYVQNPSMFAGKGSFSLISKYGTGTVTA